MIFDGKKNLFGRIHVLVLSNYQTLMLKIQRGHLHFSEFIPKFTH
jgi:hypothetical protein